ncbi:foldase protein PrsA [Limnoglobus roseus]|uniref:peptidylprolyl isomerase n=1 Tax=Limnoglobus roseus TaxID=2598579 RepID=A0A5C1AI45_9BACT|nr:peptidylprolyl isomerase [Limnoglobus roseus]QEL17342.1 peptidyl-prolyl cis-trans isomerase [Limnoglobus roseus]
MDAPLRRWLLTAGLAALAGTGCTQSRSVQVQGPAPQWMSPADEAAPVARGQSPDEPKAPTGPIVITEAMPDPLAKTPPAATPRSLVQPASATTASRSGLSALSNPLHDKQIQVAAFIGTNVVITDDEVYQMVRQRAAEYIELFGSEQTKKEQAVYREELRKLIERELIILELFTRMKKNKAEDKIEGLNDHAREQANARLATYRKARGVPEEEFIKVLRAQGLTYNGIRRQLERDALVQVYLEQMLKDKGKFVTLNDLWDYYTANPKEFTVDEKIKWLDCFVSFQRFGTAAEAKEYAENLWRAASAGGDFVEIIKKSGHGDSGLRNGEGLGTKRGDFQPAELESVIVESKEGQLSPLLQTATGYHIVKVVSVQKAGVREFDGKVQSEIRGKLTKQLQEKEYVKMIDDLWRRYRPKVVGE